MRRTVKRVIDILMVVMLPFLMVQILTGQLAHELLGCVMAVCFIIHNISNAGWYRNLFKGKYTQIRIFMTVVNLLLIIDFIAIMTSGIMMGDYVFGWLGISGHMLFARRLHLFSAWWGFILMSGHLGIHWQMIMGGFRKMFRLEKESVIRTIILRILCVGISMYGIYAFILNHVGDHLLLKTHFMFHDDANPVTFYLTEMTAIIVLFAAAFHYISRGLLWLGKKNSKRVV